MMLSDNDRYSLPSFGVANYIFVLLIPVVLSFGRVSESMRTTPHATLRPPCHA
jgi:hypothetical protein